MACRLVPIATDVGAAAETIDHMMNGVLVEPGDVLAMVSAVELLNNNRAELRRMSEMAKESSRRYHWPLIAKSTLAVYESVVARRRVSSR